MVCIISHLFIKNYRLVRSRKYIEEDDIQKNAMLVNKECKQLTYKLLEEHFISVQVNRYCYSLNLPKPFAVAILGNMSSSSNLSAEMMIPTNSNSKHLFQLDHYRHF